MNKTLKIARYQLHDMLRGKWVLVYALFFFLLTEGLLRFGGNDVKALLSLVNVVLILIPLVSVLFGSMYLYNAREFTILLLTQPLGRRALYGGLFLGLALPLTGGYLLGITLPFLMRGYLLSPNLSVLLMLLFAGALLTCIFVSLAFVIAVKFHDRVRGLGTAILVWLLATVLYDGILLLLLSALSDYPMEKPVMVLMAFNPVDLSRLILLLQFDIAALMGYTGAVFQAFFGSVVGLLIAVILLLLWFALPWWIGLCLFQAKDF